MYTLEINSECSSDLIHAVYIISSITYTTVAIDYSKSPQTGSIKSHKINISGLWVVGSLSHLFISALAVCQQTIYKQMYMMCSSKTLFTKQLADQMCPIGSSSHTSVLYYGNSQNLWVAELN